MAALQNQAVQSMWADEDNILSFMAKVKECINSLSKSSLTNQEILDCTNKFKHESLTNLSESQKIVVIEFIDMIVSLAIYEKEQC